MKIYSFVDNQIALLCFHNLFIWFYFQMRLRGRRYQNETDSKLKGMVESAEEKKHKKIKKDGEGGNDDAEEHKLK